jgi:uncharacterized SAM-binding protein YcdF (DUF218 family)
VIGSDPLLGGPIGMSSRRGDTDELPVVRARRRRSRTARRVRAVALLLLAVLGLGALYYAFTLVQVWYVARQDQARTADAIVVLGAAQFDGRPSPVLRARLDHALDLYEQGLAPVVVVTGGKMPADRFTEATASARYLADRGVPDDAILREVQGRSTWESLSATARILKGQGLDRVLLVSDPYHSLRIRETAEELGLTAYTSPTRTSPVGPGRAFRHRTREAAGIAVARLPFMDYRRLLRLTG